MIEMTVRMQRCIAEAAEALNRTPQWLTERIQESLASSTSEWISPAMLRAEARDADNEFLRILGIRAGESISRPSARVSKIDHNGDLQ